MIKQEPEGSGGGLDRENPRPFSWSLRQPTQEQIPGGTEGGALWTTPFTEGSFALSALIYYLASFLNTKKQ